MQIHITITACMSEIPNVRILLARKIENAPISLALNALSTNERKEIACGCRHDLEFRHRVPRGK